jgi:hypothetical protein
MGYYINPKNQTKEEFLLKYGEQIQEPTHHESKDGTKLVVCLFDNGWMTAAGIVVDERELQAFTIPTDDRPKKWFWVKKAELEEYLH